MSQQLTSAPSGIAKLRQSQDLTNSPDPDPMNLDDFIIPTSVTSPAGVTSPSSPGDHATANSNAIAAAIPIKPRKESTQTPHPDFAPSAPPHDRSRAREFEYVQRRVRKTSIDETRVCLHMIAVIAGAKLTCAVPSLENGLPSSLPRSLLQMASQCRMKTATKVWEIIA